MFLNTHLFNPFSVRIHKETALGTLPTGSKVTNAAFRPSEQLVAVFQNHSLSSVISYFLQHPSVCRKAVKRPPPCVVLAIEGCLNHILSVNACLANYLSKLSSFSISGSGLISNLSQFFRSTFSLVSDLKLSLVWNTCSRTRSSDIEGESHGQSIS